MKNDLIERYYNLSNLQIENLKRNKLALNPFTNEQAIKSILNERKRLIEAYQQNPLDIVTNAEIEQEIALLQAELRSTPEPEILQLRKEIEFEIDKKFNHKIGAKILKIETMKVDELKVLLAEIKNQPASQVDDFEFFNLDKNFWEKQNEQLDKLIQENKDVLF